jgi:hypothetical protein
MSSACAPVSPLGNDVQLKNTRTVKISRYRFGVGYSGPRGIQLYGILYEYGEDVASNVARERRRR